MATVNRPTDNAVKERDINQKLQLYGIFQAFSNGKVPSNKQIDVALNSFLATKAIHSPNQRLSSEGRGLMNDLKEVVQQAKYLLLSKNEGNLLQEFIWDTQHLDGSVANSPNAPIDKDTARQHGDQALEGIKTLGRLVLSNGQFRKLLSDAVVLLRDIAGDAAQNVASKVNPDEDRLNRIDDAADDNTWHDVPDLSRENIRNQARDTVNKNKPFSRGDLQEAADRGQDTAQQHPSQDNREAGVSGLRNAASHLQSKAQENIPDEHQENAQKAKDATVQKTKNYIGNKMPQERRDQTIYRLKKMVVEIQGHSDYREAIDTLLSLAEEYGGHANNMTSQSAGTVKGARSDNRLGRAEANLKTLIERFANYTSADDFFDALNAIYRDADRDPELKDWFKSVDRYVRKCLQEQGYILQDHATDEWNRLNDKGQFLLRDRYRDHTDRILDEVKFLADQFDQDPQNTAFANAMQKLFLDLGQDENGKPTFKPHLIKDLTEVIIPEIFENTRYVPIPRIEVSDPMIDAVVENLVIESDNLFPNVFEFGSDNYFRMGRKGSSNKRENKVTIAGSGIQMDLRDVAYYIKKKQGFPSITDKGVMDIFMGGEGFSFKISARNATKTDRTHFVAVDNVDVTIKNLSIKVKQSNHKLLFTIAKSILIKAMKPVIQKVIEKQIRDSFAKADNVAYQVDQDVQHAKQAAKDDPENAPNVFQSYFNSYQKIMTEKKEKAQEKSKNMNVNIAMTKEDSMFKNINLPGGVSTKATEYKELARKGDRWESPIFGIGSARESTNLPQAHKVTRKPHDTAAGRIRGGNHPNSRDDASGVSGTTAASGNYPSNLSGGGYGSSQEGGGYGSGQQAGGYGSGQQGGLAYGSSQQGGGYGSSQQTQGYSSTLPVGTGNPAAGFGTQVDQAFGAPGGNTGLNTGNTGLNTGSSNLNQNTSGKTFYDGVTQ